LTFNLKKSGYLLGIEGVLISNGKGVKRPKVVRKRKKGALPFSLFFFVFCEKLRIFALIYRNTTEITKK
jgi:hypothetical protein